MESFIWYFFLFVWILLAVIQIVMIVKFFQLAENVRILKNTATDVPDIHPKRDFYKWLVAGDMVKAKEALFEAIAQTEEFNRALRGLKEPVKLKLQNSLNREFAKELALLGIQEIDLSLIK